LHPRTAHEVSLGGGVLLIGLARVPARHRALLEVGLVAAVVDGHLVLGQVELDDAGHDARQELPVVGDQHDAGAQAAHEGLEPLQAGDVEVVGRLVEQHHVEATEQQGGECDPGGLPAGQGRHEGVHADLEPELGEHRRDPIVQVGRAGCEPTVEAVGVRRLLGPGRRRAGERGRRDLHRLGGGRGAGAAGEVGADRLALAALVLLRQPPDEGVVRRGGDRAVQWREVAGQDAQEGRLAGPVGADHADDVAGRDGEVEPLEEDAVRVSAGEVLGDQARAHPPILGTRWVRSGRAVVRG